MKRPSSRAFAPCREIAIFGWTVSSDDMANDTQEDSTLDDLITSDPEVLGGRQVFRGTRISIEVLFENLADGMSIDESLEEYDTLDRGDVVRILELTSATLANPRAA